MPGTRFLCIPRVNALDLAVSAGFSCIVERNRFGVKQRRVLVCETQVDGNLLCLYLHIGKLVGLDEVRCFYVRNVSTSEGYLHSLGVQPARRIFLSPPTDDAVSLASLIFPSKCGDKKGQPVRSTVDISVDALFHRICTKVGRESDWNFIVTGHRVQSSLQYSRLPL